MADGSVAPPPLRFAPCARRRAYEDVVEQIEQAILTGALRVNDRLPSEREMLLQFGVGRTTIREALRVLQSRGLISVRHGDPAGPLVTADPGAGMTSVLESLHRAERLQLVDVVQLRMVIESAAAGLAAAAAAGPIAAIRAAYGAMEQGADRAELRRLDILFHRRVAEAAGNPLLALVAEALHQFGSVAHGLDDLPLAQAQRRALAVHGEILAAIEAGRPHAAARAARTHLRRTYGRKLRPEHRQRLAAVDAALEEQRPGDPADPP